MPQITVDGMYDGAGVYASTHLGRRCRRVPRCATRFESTATESLPSVRLLKSAPVPQRATCTAPRALPGLIDAHVHMVLDPDLRDPLAQTAADRATRAAAMAQRAVEMVRAGITTARDLGGGEWLELELRDRIARGEVEGPRLVCAGQPVTSPQGHCHFWGGEATGAADAAAVIARQREHGVDLIKVMATGGTMTKGTHPARRAIRSRNAHGDRCSRAPTRLPGGGALPRYRRNPLRGRCRRQHHRALLVGGRKRLGGRLRRGHSGCDRRARHLGFTDGQPRLEAPSRQRQRPREAPDGEFRGDACSGSAARGLDRCWYSERAPRRSREGAARVRASCGAVECRKCCARPPRIARRRSASVI